MRDPRETRVRDWLDDHPWTACYIAAVVTINFVVTIIEAATR